MQGKINRKNIWEHIDVTDSCWNWIGSKTEGGYGQMSYAGKRFMAHRFVYELLEGKIPKGLQLDHLCRNRACVNPAHLDTVTQQENILRGIGQSTINAKKTDCPQNHNYSLENTYIYPNGDRRCRICKRTQDKQYEQRKREGKLYVRI